MSISNNLYPWAGGHPGPARDPAGVRPALSEPTANPGATAQSLTTPRAAVNPSPEAERAAEWQRRPDPNDRQPVPPAADEAGDREPLRGVLERLNQGLDLYNTTLHFEIDEQYDAPVVRIVDVATREVVRQIPPEQALAFAQFFDELEQTRQVNKPALVPGASTHNESGRLSIEGWLLRATA